MKKLILSRQALSVLFAIGLVPFLSSCDEAAKPEKAESEHESKEVEVAEEAEGAEAAKEALKKKGEEEEKESEERKERLEDNKSGAEHSAKSSSGMMKRK